MGKILQNRWVLLTGATGGLGRAIAMRFAKEGANLILVGRKSQSLEVLDDALAPEGVQTILVPLDLKHLEAIDEMALALAERLGSLEVLIGNAGILGSLGPITHQDAKVWRDVLDVNLSANWRLMRAFDPLLRKGQDPRALFVTSEAARTPQSYWNAYGISKAALEHLVKLYAAENERISPVKANLISPGNVHTSMRSAAFPGENPQSLALPDDIMDVFVYGASSQCQENGQIFYAQKPDFGREAA